MTEYEIDELLEMVEIAETSAMDELKAFGCWEPFESFTWEGMVEPHNFAEWDASTAYASEELL